MPPTMSAQPENSGNSSFKELLLTAGWQLTSTEPGAADSPDDLIAELAWQPAIVPGTVAMALNADIDTPAPYDERDWWYRLRFTLDETQDSGRHFLHCEGLATISEVWLNGVRVLTSRNMFVGHRIDVSTHLRANNVLVIAFRALKTAPHPTRPRARWRTGLVERQNLRWFRTTLLGRIPGWTPQIDPVGPWRGIALERCNVVSIAGLDLQASARNGKGQLSLHAHLEACSDASITKAILRVGDSEFPLQLEPGPTAMLRESIDMGDVPLWWPHTHGIPTLVPWSLNVQAGGRSVTVAAGRIGFKEITLDQTNGKVQFIVNGVPVFCRGACWITGDILALHGDREKLRALLILARDAGLNMLRVSGTATYESDAFYSLCDELGIFVWQDFMFANMDYPFKDAAFHADVDAEVSYQILRTQRHVCIAAYCGGSEVAQQAAMMGLPDADWMNDFFATELPAQCAQLHTGIPYFPNTPWGGALPFHVATGISHYYGVGAYLRPIADVKSAGVKFTTECLGFSNVPEPALMDSILGGRPIAPHHPKWKARLPRDNGAGWDFEDVRDHYFRELYGTDPIDMRSQDMSAYLALSRVVPGEVMQQVFSEWRKADAPCSGGLVWFFADLVPGAGWGIIDSTGRPKATYWYLKRAWATRAVRFTNEGLDGLNVQVVNELPEPLDAFIEVEFVNGGSRTSAGARERVAVPPRATVAIQLDALLGYFSDAGYVYRFGPPRHEVVLVRLVDAVSERVISEDFHFPLGHKLATQPTSAVTCTAARLGDGAISLAISSEVFLQAVSVLTENFLPDDNHFHLAPGHRRELQLGLKEPGNGPLEIRVSALNLRGSITLTV